MLTSVTKESYDNNNNSYGKNNLHGRRGKKINERDIMIILVKKRWKGSNN